MDMFVALADPTRRQILELLATRSELPATAIYEHFPVSPQAVSQHLKILREAHLVEMEKQAQKRLYRLNPETLSQFEAGSAHAADPATEEQCFRTGEIWELGGRLSFGGDQKEDEQ